MFGMEYMDYLVKWYLYLKKYLNNKFVGWNNDWNRKLLFLFEALNDSCIFSYQ